MPVAVAVADVRDLVIVVWGIVSIVFVLLRLVLAGGTLYFGRKLMNLLHRQTHERVQPALGRALQVSESIRDRTARLPGAPGSTGGTAELLEAAQEIRDMQPPFRSRKRSWRPF